MNENRWCMRPTESRLVGVVMLLAVLVGCTNSGEPDIAPTARIAGTYLARLTGHPEMTEILLGVEQSPDDQLSGAAIDLGSHAGGSVTGSVSGSEATIVVGISVEQITLVAPRATDSGHLSGAWSGTGGRTGTWSALRATEPIVRLVAPPDLSTVDRTLHVRFEWAVYNTVPGENHLAAVFTDKGPGPFDGAYEDRWDAGAATSLTVALPSRRYLHSSFQWGVCVTSAAGVHTCSNVRRLIVP